MIRDFSIWEYDAYHKLWDICIVGAGINGLSAGISLLERIPDLKILILDRWFIPLGASTRNAGFACFGSPSEVIDDIAHLGEQNASELVQKRWRGLQLLKKRLEGSNARYESYGGYELYTKNKFDEVGSSLPYLNTLLGELIGQDNIYEEINVPAGIRGFSHAVYNPYEGQLHAGFMIEHLKEMFLSLGGKIYTGVTIEQVEEKSDHIVLSNSLSIPFEAKKVIISVNAFAASLFPDLDVHGVRNHVFVTSPLKGLSWKGCFHYDKGFYYFRNIGERILLGGARNKDFEKENTETFGRNPVIVEELNRFLYQHLASKENVQIDYEWSGIMAFGADKLPIVKAVSSRIYLGLRCSGMGIALASLIGEELADLICNSQVD
ncbi:MAG: FAD-binding oxidoreductase [Bacteroidota bacterium]|nr:FAD-binding oxidoreductase [Bacteroidota bacterium]